MCTENLALHKQAWQSNTEAFHTGAELAVDGNNIYSGWYVGKCAVSDDVQAAEWQVDLGGVKNIHHVFLQHATGKSMLGTLFLMFIDSHLKLIDAQLILISGTNEG